MAGFEGQAGQADPAPVLGGDADYLACTAAGGNVESLPVAQGVRCPGGEKEQALTFPERGVGEDHAELRRVAAEHSVGLARVMLSPTRFRKAWWMLIQATLPIRNVSAKPRLRV
jgi:hypothetical protein